MIIEGHLKLNLLPADLLVDIFSLWNTSTLVIQLWKCGDSKLNGNLARSITCIDLVDTRLCSTSRWPNMLSSLTNLRVLSINRGHFWLVDSSAALIGRLKDLRASKLEKLEIVSAENFLLRNDLLSSTLHSDPSYLDLSDQFPCLTSLYIAIPKDNTSQPFSLPNWPQTLIHLSLPPISLSPETGPLFSLLPRSLKTFTSSFSFNFPNAGGAADANSTASDCISNLHHIFANAPPHLEELSRFNCSALEPKRFDWIPKSVIEFDASSVAPSVDPLAHLPPSLLKFTSTAQRLGDSSDVWVPQLPQKLQVLVFLQSKSTDFSTSSITLLPPNLKSLGIDIVRASRIIFDWSQMRSWSSSVPFWPSQLASLYLPKLTITTRDLELLPANLTHLSCHWTETSFPIRRGLKALGISLTVTSFCLRSVETWNLAVLPQKEDEKLDDEIVSSFRAFTVNFDLRRLSEHPLPSKLVHLMVVSWKFQSLALLPRSLTRFEFSYLDQMPTGDQTHAGDLFSNLPSGLLSLAATGSAGDSMPIYSSASFASLPNLTSLKVRDFVWLDPGVLKTLASTARGLRSLTISLVTIDEENARCMPRNLRDLDLELRFRDNIELLTEFWPPNAIKYRDPSKHALYKKRAAEYPDPRVLESPFANRM